MYFGLMIASFITIKTQLLDRIRVQPSWLSSAWGVQWSFFASICLAAVLSVADPGYVRKEAEDEDHFLKLLINYDPATICPDC